MKKRIKFFGGEPLMEFNLLKKVVLYLEDRYSNHPKGYSISTNGTLLTLDILSFLNAHDFRIYVSLDAPRFLHDSRRMTPSKGMTYDLINSNLVFYKQHFPQSYAHNLTFCATYMSKDEVYMGLTEFDNLGRFKTDYSAVLGDLSKRPTEVRRLCYRDEFLNSKFMTAFAVGDYNRMWLYGNYFLTFCIRIDNRIIFPRGYDPEFKFSHFCAPFCNNLIVQANGEYSFCQFLDHVRFSNVKIGEFFWENKIIQGYTSALDQYRENECKYCFAKRICSLCWAHYFTSDGSLSDDRLRNNCSEERLKIKELLSIYLLLKLKDPNIFHDLKKHPPVNLI